MNYMQALRYIAAKGQQKAIIVYWDTLQLGKYNTATKTTIWSDFRNETLSDSVSLRYGAFRPRGCGDGRMGNLVSC